MMDKRIMSLAGSCMIFCAWIVMIIIILGAIGCGASHQLTNEDITWVDDDRYNLPKAPKLRDPNYTWDFIHRSFIYPVDRITDVPRYFSSNEAQNTNALGEVPDSSWYTNRHARKRMTMDELITGPNVGTGPDLTGVWTIVKSKTQGVTPGFNIEDSKGDVYVIKFDPIDHPEMATAAEVISTLFLHAAGYNTPENYIIHFDPKKLVIGDGAKITDDKGKKRQMTEADLAEILRRVSHRPDGTIRALASKFLTGTPVGPFSYRSRRKDDPNDIYSHRNRRELRGLRVVASFLNHVDIKGPNTLDMYVTEDDRSYVKHYLIDFGATLGSASTHPHNAPTGHEHSFDVAWFFKSLLTLGLMGKPWDNATTLEHPAVGFFEAETFNPGKWKSSYTNPAFLEMENQDAYWGAKIVMAFTSDDILEIVKQGRYSDPEVERYIADILNRRREKVGRYWYNEVNPLDRFTLKQDGERLSLQFTDMGVEGGLWQPAEYHYELRHCESNELIDSAALTGSMEIAISAEVLSSMDSLSQSRTTDDQHRFFCYTLRIEREGKLSKAVRVYLYHSEHGSDRLKIVHVERDG
jgi:hypothetical protein